MADLNFSIVDVKKWESLPSPAPPKAPDRYDKVLDALEAGEIVHSFDLVCYLFPI